MTSDNKYKDVSYILKQLNLADDSNKRLHDQLKQQEQVTATLQKKILSLEGFDARKGTSHDESILASAAMNLDRLLSKTTAYIMRTIRQTDPHNVLQSLQSDTGLSRSRLKGNSDNFSMTMRIQHLVRHQMCRTLFHNVLNVYVVSEDSVLNSMVLKMAAAIDQSAGKDSATVWRRLTAEVCNSQPSAAFASTIFAAGLPSTYPILVDLDQQQHKSNDRKGKDLASYLLQLTTEACQFSKLLRSSSAVSEGAILPFLPEIGASHGLDLCELSHSCLQDTRVHLVAACASPGILIDRLSSPLGSKLSSTGAGSTVIQKAHVICTCNVD